jgi:arabinofuranosyltransferase
MILTEVFKNKDTRQRGSTKPTLEESVPFRLSPFFLGACIPSSIFMSLFVFRNSFKFNDRRYFTLFDDAMISMTYARTFAQTGNLIWTPGSNRVQGFTNPLYVLIMAGLHKVGLNSERGSLVISLLGAALIIATSLIVGYLVSSSVSTNARFVILIATGSIGLTYPLAFWTLRGMEVGLIAFLLISMVCVLESSWSFSDAQRYAVASVLGCFGVASRIDFILFVFTAAAVLFFLQSSVRSRKVLLTNYFAPVLIFFCTLLVLQKFYYNSWLGNTYELKMTGFSVWTRLVRGSIASAKFIPVVLLSLISLMGIIFSNQKSSRKRSLGIHLFALILTSTGYSVWVGGDAWENWSMANRFLSAALPLTVVLTMISYSDLYKRFEATSRSSLLRLLFLFLLTSASIGLTTNPINISLSASLVGISITVVFAIVLYALKLYSSRVQEREIGEKLLGLLLLIFILLITSIIPFRYWVSNNAQYSMSDQTNLINGLLIKDFTKPNARVAVLAAGSIIYYTDRDGIDLLGKSSKQIAQSPPAKVSKEKFNSSFYPGHNKWNYEYSIGKLRPDVVFQNWGEDSLPSRMITWGYERVCLSSGHKFWALSASSYVNMMAVAQC